MDKVDGKRVRTTIGSSWTLSMYELLPIVRLKYWELEPDGYEWKRFDFFEAWYCLRLQVYISHMCVSFPVATINRHYHHQKKSRMDRLGHWLPTMTIVGWLFWFGLVEKWCYWQLSVDFFDTKRVAMSKLLYGDTCVIIVSHFMSSTKADLPLHEWHSTEEETDHRLRTSWLTLRELGVK